MKFDRSKHGGSVVSGPRRGRGAIIGEALSGGRNSSGGPAHADGWSGLRKKTEARPARPGGFNIVQQAFVVASGGLPRLLIVGIACYIFFHNINQLPYLKIVPVPLLLALWCGAGFGSSAKRLVRFGRAETPAAALGAGLGALLVGAGLYAWFVYIGIYPASELIHIFNLPYETHEYLMILDDGVFYLLGTLDRAFFAVTPLCGVVLGWVSGRR